MPNSIKTGTLLTAISAAKNDIDQLQLNVAVNPHYKSTFIPLENIEAQVSPILRVYGLEMITGFRFADGKVFSVTELIHAESGEKRESWFPVTDCSPQKAGAAQTYGRRYAFYGLLGIAGEPDDDGNTASGVGKKKSGPSSVPARNSAPKPQPVARHGNGTIKSPPPQHNTAVLVPDDEIDWV